MSTIEPKVGESLKEELSLKLQAYVASLRSHTPDEDVAAMVGEPDATWETTGWLYGLADLIEEANRRLSNERAIPPGWKLVPIEATREMCLAAYGKLDKDDREEDILEYHRGTWSEYIAAAPEVPLHE